MVNIVLKTLKTVEDITRNVASGQAQTATGANR